jgi:hypothetical protein
LNLTCMAIRHIRLSRTANLSRQRPYVGVMSGSMHGLERFPFDVNRNEPGASLGRANRFMCLGGVRQAQGGTAQGRRAHSHRHRVNSSKKSCARGMCPLLSTCRLRVMTRISRELPLLVSNLLNLDSSPPARSATGRYLDRGGCRSQREPLCRTDVCYCPTLAGPFWRENHHGESI